MKEKIKQYMMRDRIEEKLFGAIGTDDCHTVGIMGGCGEGCIVYREGRCPEPDGIEETHK